MDYDKLIEHLRECGTYGFKQEECRDAALAIETLRAENERLRNEAEGMRSNWYKSVEKIKNLQADLARVTAERDGAIKDLNEFLAMDELCPIQCEWCKWNGTYCDGKTPEWRGVQNE